MTEKSHYLGLLTFSQSEVLSALHELHRQRALELCWRPRDLGAYKSSHHAQTLKRLASKGLVSRHKTTGGYAYALTDTGKSTWALLEDAARVGAHTVFGGAETRRRVRALQALTA